MPDLVWIILLFFGIAVMYSSVGFGGGSSYLAILAAFGIPFPELRFYALICNIVVVTGSVIYFHRRSILQWKKTIPIILMSIPFAFFGGSFRLTSQGFFLILATVLLVSGLIMTWQSIRGKIQVSIRPFSTLQSGIMGAGIGFLSGLSGIGGGIFLSPVLNLSSWDRPKVIAATASLFILANSLAGLGGQLTTYSFSVDKLLIFSLPLTVWAGGFLGRRMGVQLFRPKHVKLVTAILILLIAIRIYIKYL